MKIKQWIICLLAFSLFGQVEAKIIPKDKGSKSKTHKSRSSSSSSSSNAVVKGEGCSDPVLGGKLENFVPLELLQSLIKEDEKISFDLSDGEGYLKLPWRMSNCFKFKVYSREVEGDDGETNLVVGVVNDEEFTRENTGLDKVEGKSFNDLYEACLEHQGIVEVDDEGDKFFDRDKADKDNSPLPVNFTYNADKSLPIFYAEPSHASLHGYELPEGSKEADFDMPADGDAMRCTKPITFGDNGPKYAYKSEFQVAFERFKENCGTGDLSHASAEVARLESSVAGNVKEVFLGPWREIVAKLRQDKADEIYERMDEISDSFKPDEEDAENGERVGLDKSESKEAIKEFRAELSKLYRTVIKPSIDDVKDLLEQRKDASEDEKEAIDEQVKELNNLIAGFGKKQGDFEALYHGMEVHGLDSEGRGAGNLLEIEKVISISNNYGRVYKGEKDSVRGKALTLAKAEKNVEKEQRALKKDVLPYRDARYEVSRGNQYALDGYKERIDRKIKIKKKALSYHFKNYETRQRREYCEDERSVSCAYYNTPGARYNRWNNFLGSRTARRSLGRIDNWNNQYQSLTDLYHTFGVSAQRRQIASYEDDFFGGYSNSRFGESANYFDWNHGFSLRAPGSHYDLGGGDLQYQLMMGNQFAPGVYPIAPAPTPTNMDHIIRGHFNIP